MARFNDLNQSSGGTLARAYGIHLVQGTLVMHEETIVGTDKAYTVLQALADGPWDGVVELARIALGRPQKPPTTTQRRPEWT